MQTIHPACNARHRRYAVFALALVFALPCSNAWAGQGENLTGETSTAALARMQADASAIQQIAQTWQEIEGDATSYGKLAPYAVQEWAGQGPLVRTLYGGVEQCHNSQWDKLTVNLVTGGLNIAGDAEAEAYALEIVTADFQEQYSNYLTDQVADQTPEAQAMTQNLQALEASAQNLGSLLTGIGNQISAALGNNSPLRPLPIQQWQAGIGDVPNLATVRYLPGPNDGAPMGWTIRPTWGLARLVDICPTGTAAIPMLPLRAPVLSAARLAVAEEPDMASQLQPLEGGSTWNLPTSTMALTGLPTPAWYARRIQLVSAIAADMPTIAGLMAPINAPLLSYKQNVQTLLKEIPNAR